MESTEKNFKQPVLNSASAALANVLLLVFFFFSFSSLACQIVRHHIRVCAWIDPSFWLPRAHFKSLVKPTAAPGRCSHCQNASSVVSACPRRPCSGPFRIGHPAKLSQRGASLPRGWNSQYRESRLGIRLARIMTVNVITAGYLVGFCLR